MSVHLGAVFIDSTVHNSEQRTMSLALESVSIRHFALFPTLWDCLQALHLLPFFQCIVCFCGCRPASDDRGGIHGERLPGLLLESKRAQKHWRNMCVYFYIQTAQAHLSQLTRIHWSGGWQAENIQLSDVICCECFSYNCWTLIFIFYIYHIIIFIAPFKRKRHFSPTSSRLERQVEVNQHLSLQNGYTYYTLLGPDRFIGLPI